MLSSREERRSKLIPAQGRRSLYGGLGVRPENSGLRRKAETSTLTSAEITSKCQIILSEIDRCKHSKERYIESCVLHGVPQTFVPSELRVELEEELDQLLTEQILRDERLLATSSSSAAPSDPVGSSSYNLNRTENEILESTQNDADACLACNGHCAWAPFCDSSALTKRKKELYRELKSCEKQVGVIVESTVARSAINGGEMKFVREQLMKELSDEIKQIDTMLSLARIDSELHQTYASNDELVIIRSIHGYDMTVKRRDGISALEFEHNTHISKIISAEVVDNILQWMLEGWYFGERDTKDDGQLMEVPLYDQRGSLADRASGVQRNSNANAIRDARANESATEDLRGLEKTMKYGLFCLTFMYFRALHTLCKERATWDGSNDLVTLRHGPPLSEERKKIIQEEKNAEFRRKRIECVMQKAKAGEERWRQWSERERLEKTKVKQWHNKKKQAEHRLAVTLQRVFRGFLGRKVARMRSLKRDKIKSDELLKNACATDIARVWRGYCGRIDAGYLRAEMAKFLFAIREEEARDEEEEFLALQRYSSIKLQANYNSDGSWKHANRIHP